MRALDDISKLKDKTPKLTLGAVESKVKAIKSKYYIEEATLKNIEDGSVKVYVKHKKENNNKNLVEIPVMSESERQKLIDEAVKDLKTQLDKKVDDKGKMPQATAQNIGVTIKKEHDVIEDITIVDGGASWDYKLILGDKNQTIPGQPKAEIEEGKELDAGENILGLTEAIKIEGGHNLKIEGTFNKIELNVYSNRKTLNKIIEEKSTELKDHKDEDKNAALNSIVSLQNTLNNLVAKYKAAVEDAYESGKKAEIIDAHDKIKLTLDLIGNNLEILGIKAEDWERPESVVTHQMSNGKSKKVTAAPLTEVPGNTRGSAAAADPPGWESIPLALRNNTSWVRAHLLNHNLHGPGDEKWNIFPGSHDMNTSKMLPIENIIKSKILEKKEVLYYEITLTYGNTGTYDFIPTKVTLEYGEYEPRKKIDSVTKDQEPPTAAALETNNINASPASSLTAVAAENGADGMNDFFSLLVKERDPNNKYTDDIDDIKARLESHYTYKGAFMKNIDKLEILLEKNKLKV